MYNKCIHVEEIGTFLVHVGAIATCIQGTYMYTHVGLQKQLHSIAIYCIAASFCGSSLERNFTKQISQFVKCVCMQVAIFHSSTQMHDIYDL